MRKSTWYEEIGYWIKDQFWIVFLITLIGLAVTAAVVGTKQDIKAENNFMAQCLHDHKQYECTAMWRAGEDHDVPVVIPMPIYTGR